MVEIQTLIATIYILYYSLIGVSIITFALIIALVVIISKQNWFYNFSWGNKSPNYFLYKNSIYPSSLIKLFYYKKQTKEIKINAK